MGTRQEQTEVNARMVILWTVAIVVAMLGCWLVALRVVRDRPHGPLPAPVSPPGQKPHIAVLENHPFNTPGPGGKLVRAQRRYLRSYGWLDAARTRAHVPIARAEVMILSGQGGFDAGH